MTRPTNRKYMLPTKTTSWHCPCRQKHPVCGPAVVAGLSLGLAVAPKGVGSVLALCLPHRLVGNASVRPGPGLGLGLGLALPSHCEPLLFA